jgi:hypothetical protein
MTRKRFAEATEVPVTKTRAELEELLTRYQATATAIFTSADHAAVAFEMHGRRVVMKLQLPDARDRQFTHGRVNQHAGVALLTPEAAKAKHEKACRRKWRALLLAVKAKLVAVEDGIETFEEAFMAHVVMPDGRTVADHIKPRIATAYRENKMAPLLPYHGGGDAGA